MKNKNLVFLSLFLLAMGCTKAVKDDKASATWATLLEREFELGGDRTAENRIYIVESEFVHFAPDGGRAGSDTFVLELECLPSSLSRSDREEYTCRRFSVRLEGEAPVSIPALEGWSYSFIWGLDEGGQVFGIDHAAFEDLRTEDDVPLDQETSYLVYNTFIDFHGFCDVFAMPTPSGGGIQDLKKIGDKIVHAAAHTEPPVNLGSQIAEGSTFKNGEVTLEFKGVSLVEGAPCAVIGFDSGESSFRMIIEPTPKMRIETAGSSHYKGDLYIAMESNWVQKAVMGEIVVSETSLPVAPHTIGSVIERTTTIRRAGVD